MTLRPALLFVVLAALSGCVHYNWVKPSGDPSTFAADSYNCKQSSMNTAPPVFQTYGAPPPPPVRTRCYDDGRREVCKTTVSGDYAPPPQTVDLNASNRDDIYNSCMYAHGWVLQRVEE